MNHVRFARTEDGDYVVHLPGNEFAYQGTQEQMLSVLRRFRSALTNRETIQAVDIVIGNITQENSK